MINVEDLDFKWLRRTRKVNGEKTIDIEILPTEKNQQFFDLVVEEASIKVFDDSYVVKKLTERSIGKTYWKQAAAIHEFFVTLINMQQPLIHNGSITFQNYMNLVFEGTGYTFVALDQFNAREFENLGNDNRLALLKKGIERFEAEFELVGNEVRFKKQIGNDSDFQFRYGHNIKSLTREIDTTNLATRIRGTGDPELGIEAEYISPNAAIFGIIDAPPVDDERFKSEESLLAEMKRRLQDEPEVSIKVNFADLRAAGYPYEVPHEGDRVWLIYEPMDDLMIETRIMEIEEEFDNNLEVTRTIVTLSNYTKTFAGTMLDTIQKQLAEIVTDDGVVKHSALDEAVRLATKAIQNAQTELTFPNEGGIYAIDKADPNKLVVFNSAGIGISSDGGNTFETAMTGDGIVADVITAGTLRGIDIIGTNLISFNEITEDTVTIMDGTIQTQVTGKRRFGIYGNGLVAYHWETESEVVTFRASHINNERFGAGINASGDYFRIGRSVGGGSSQPQLHFSWDGAYDRVSLYGGAGIRDSGHLELRSTHTGGTADFRVPRVIIDNRTVDGTAYSGVRVYVGRDNRYPSTSNFRSGFEVWQYQGDSEGSAHRMLVIDTNTSGIKYIDADVDDFWVRGTIRTPERLLLSGDGASSASNGIQLRPYQTGAEHIITSHTSGGEFVIYPNRWSGRDRFRIRSHAGKSDYVDDLVISNSGYLLSRLDVKSPYFTITNGTPGDSETNDRVWMRYESSNFIISTKDSSGDWWKRIEVEGRGGTSTSTTHLRDRIRSQGTRNRVVTWGARVAMSDSGYMGYVSSSERFKLIIEDVDVDPYLIHKLNVKSWYDRYNAERYAELLSKKEKGEKVSFEEIEKIERIPGLIAEEVHDAGLTLFVNYDNEGRPEGIDETRLWMLLIPISRDHETRLNEYDERFGTIESRIDRLERELEKLKGVA